jgi:carbon storage regulator
MLILNRSRGEEVIINDNIRIAIVDVIPAEKGRGFKVRLGVDAPKEIPVHRREVYDAIKRSEACASK